MNAVAGGRAGGSLLALRTRAVVHAIALTPGRFVAGALLLCLVGWGLFEATLRGVRFVDGLPAIGTIADAALQRSVEALVTLLMLAVAFSVLTTAITTLYASDDLPFLLALPLPARRIFALKAFEAYLGAAALPALLTVPVLAGLGVARAAPPLYYPTSIVAVLALFALPVAAGAALALALVRVAPPGRVREFATATSVLVAAGLVVGLRALRPERLGELTVEEFEGMLAALAGLGIGWLPPGWAGATVWGALGGAFVPSAAVLLLTAALAMWAVGALAAAAYRQGWVRSGDAGRAPVDARPRRAAAWERPLAALGRTGAVVVKDLRLALRDPSQWSQLLVLVALAGVYLVSTASIEVEGQRFRDVVGTLNLAFLSFLLAGVGVRVAFPAVSLEGEGWWLVRTAPVSVATVVGAKLLHVMPTMVTLGVGLAVAQALLLDVSHTLATASLVAGACAAVAVSALGVGLGAAFPRFGATNPAEVPMSPGGVAYMALALLYAGALTTVLAYPAWRALVEPGAPVWSTPEGRATLVVAVGLTVVVSAAALALGVLRLRRLETGRE